MKSYIWVLHDKVCIENRHQTNLCLKEIRQGVQTLLTILDSMVYISAFQVKSYDTIKFVP